jgi:hypothetical protein
MAAPNIKNPSAIYARAASSQATTTLANFLVNPADSNKVFKVNSIYCANITANPVGITLVFDNGTTQRAMAPGVIIPENATQVVIGGPAYTYIPEGCKLMIQSTANTAVDVVISYEEIS